MKKLFAIAAVMGIYTTSATAAVRLQLLENGSNINITLAGTLDLTGLTSDGQTYGALADSIQPLFATIQVGGPFAAPTLAYTGITGPTTFGTGSGNAFFTSSAGDPVYLINGFGLSQLYLPLSYVSGAPLSATGTIINSSFFGIGMVPGEYVYRLASGDTFTVAAGVVPEPDTGMLGIAGVVFVALAAYRRCNV